MKESEGMEENDIKGKWEGKLEKRGRKWNADEKLRG